MKKIEIIIDANGQSTVETKGFNGSECLEASRFIESALGKQVNQRTTTEFFAAEINRQQTAVNGQ